MTLTKSAFIGIISFIVIVGFSTPFTTYAWGGDSFFFPTSAQGPHEQLVVYAFGPTSPNTSYYTYQPAYTYNNQYYPSQKTYPSYGNPAMGPIFNSKFANYVNVAPQYYGGQSYSQPNYHPMQNSYSYPQYSSFSYTQPSYGYSGSYAQPTGGTDFWGNQLCNWGADYQGYPCDRDPHQWIQDPYTGSWY